MTKISFCVPLPPFGKSRPRFSIRVSRTIAYTPEKTRIGERTIRTYARRAMGDRYPFEKSTPVRVFIVAAFPIPKSYTKKVHEQCLTHDLWPVKKPDIDNIVKAVLDALNDAVFFDDCQVIELHVTKTYVESEGHIEIECEALEPNL